jgi:hypothetical protein
MSAGALERLGLRDVDAVKSRVGGHWSALLDATRAADLDAIHTQLAALHTLADSGCYRCLAQHDPRGLLHFSHQLRTLRVNLVKLGDRQKRGTTALAMGGYIVGPLISLVGGWPWGIPGLLVGVLFLLLTLFGSAAPLRLEEALKVLDGLVTRVQTSLEGRL